MHGFSSGFVSSLGGSFMQSNGGKMSAGTQIAMSAVIGGTAEKIGGGKFANGAVTGAYVMMFNHLSQQQKSSKGRTLSEKQRNEAEMKIQMASEKYRQRMIEYLDGEIEDWGGFRFDMNIEGIGEKNAMGLSGYYSANDIQLKLTNETLIIDIQITMTTKSDNTVGIITQPATNWNNRILMEHYKNRGSLVILFFRSSADLKKYQSFLNGD